MRGIIEKICILIVFFAFFLVLPCWGGKAIVVPNEVDWTKAENLAKGKPVKIPKKGEEDIKANPGWGPPEKATNGNRDTNDWLGWNMGDVENQGWVEIDLGSDLWFDALRMWHYYGDGRTYKVAWTVVSTTGAFKDEEKVLFDTRKPKEAMGKPWIGDVSDDKKVKFKSHAGGTYAETPGGRVDLFNPVFARYLRDYCEHAGNSHWVEIEVYSFMGPGAVQPVDKLALTWGQIKSLEKQQ